MPPGQGSSRAGGCWLPVVWLPALSRVAMCVGRCSRIVGPCLLVLGTFSMAANVLLLFPGGTAKYLLEGHISKQAKAVPGVWGGGLLVLLAATYTAAVGWRCPGCSGCGTRSNAFISAVLSKLALLGAAACFVLSGVGLTNGPLCFYNASEYGQGLLWGYPFLDVGGQEPDARAGNYLHDRSTWSICLEPAGVVAWNVVLFSLLLLLSAAEMVLASLQVLNGCLGCLCGFCEGK
ncbi:transmembrane 4 L6 family member 19 isoform X2 [Apus apus]|uniref:transmembrane 4 L6 family member 19 isoform X2 n=1 Tax=Apus apus TaxID=8895 RepID=UPI0021F8F465|nr:transmembrane 4 L6 family member 19 isoform X2 [Apus apus]